MDTSVSYRRLKRRDYKEVRALICDAWRYDQAISNPRELNEFLELQLYNVLCHSNYTEVAVIGGRVAGFLFGRVNKSPRLLPRLKFAGPREFDRLKLYFTAMGRKQLRAEAILSDIYKRLIKGRKKEYGGELVLFVVSEDYRGKGIGSHLQEGFKNYLRSRRVRSMCVYTDTYCNYKFYEDHGFRLVDWEYIDWWRRKKLKNGRHKVFLYAKDL